MYFCNMYFVRINIIISALLYTLLSSAQDNIDCAEWDLETGSYLALDDSIKFSMSQVSEALVMQSDMVFCPAGIERSSPDDVKKRFSFDWTVKYNNIYLRSKEGVVFEGMNEHGFSASLTFLENSQLPSREKRHIPIAASLAVNFFIDHFKCVDTALLAVWDIRIFDDLGFDCNWPFRIILHDSTGVSVFFEYVNGSRQVYTHDAPAFIVGGPEYSRLIMIEHLPDSLPGGKAEKLYSDIIKTGYPPNIDLLLLQYYMHNLKGDRYFTILRYPLSLEMNFMLPGGDEARFDLKNIEFTPGKEVFTKFF